jgi:glycosyltransferase involved in cell wall biosynthesis/MoaA/NifB/PqqE/SkfB family radical SAM enzyme
MGKDGYCHEQMDLGFAKLIKKIRPDLAHIGHLNHLSTGLVDVLNELSIPIVFTLHDFWLMCPRGQFLTRGIREENTFQICSKQDDRKCACDCYEVYFSGRKAEREKDINAWSHWIKRRMEETRALVDKVDLFIAPAQYLRDRFIHDFAVPPCKIVYLDYGFPMEYLVPIKEHSKESPFTFGYIGTHIPSKGINLLIEAVKQIHQPVNLKIFGKDIGQGTSALKRITDSAGGRIEFCGEYINHNLANDVFSKVNCIVVPSIWCENSPLVIHEAQACKIPVITADYGGMKEYVNHKINGLLFKHRDIHSLVEQMTFAAKHPDLMMRLGERGYLHSPDGRVPDIYSHCKTMEEIYCRVMHKKLWRITIDTNPEDCNLYCIMCEEHSPYSNFKEELFEKTGIRHRRMDFSVVARIFEEAARLNVKEVIPSTMGEPLLYKNIEQIFELSKKHNIKINLTTNGTFPKHSMTEWAKLILPNTSDIKISWNGASAPTAEKIMGGLNFNHVLKNIRELIFERDRLFSETGYYCRISFQLTFMQNNMHELADIVKLAAELGVDRVKGHHLWTHFESIQHLSVKASKESITQWNEYVEKVFDVRKKYRKPNGEEVLLENFFSIFPTENNEVPEEYECPFLGRELWISATGKISPCCAPDNLRKSLGDFGNIVDTSIADVMGGKKYKELVKNYRKVKLCKGCNMRKP